MGRLLRRGARIAGLEPPEPDNGINNNREISKERHPRNTLTTISFFLFFLILFYLVI
jgi:hypothetical protein